MIFLDSLYARRGDFEAVRGASRRWQNPQTKSRYGAPGARVAGLGLPSANARTHLALAVEMGPDSLYGLGVLPAPLSLCRHRGLRPPPAWPRWGAARTAGGSPQPSPPGRRGGSGLDALRPALRHPKRTFRCAAVRAVPCAPIDVQPNIRSHILSDVRLCAVCSAPHFSGAVPARAGVGSPDWTPCVPPCRTPSCICRCADFVCRLTRFSAHTDVLHIVHEGTMGNVLRQRTAPAECTGVLAYELSREQLCLNTPTGPPDGATDQVRCGPSSRPVSYR